MKEQSLERANAIKRELEEINKNNKSLDVPDESLKESELYFQYKARKVGQSSFEQSSRFPFTDSETGNDTILQEKIKEEMLRCMENIRRVVDKRVKELNKEFESL